MIQLRCASPFQTGTSRTSLWISNHIRAVHLHNVRLYKKSGFSRTGTANYQNVFIPGVFRILWSAWHSKTLCFCENNIIFKFRISIWSYIFFCSPWSVLSSAFLSYWRNIGSFFHDKAPRGHTWGCGIMVEVAKWQSGKVSGFCHLDFASSLF